MKSSTPLKMLLPACLAGLVSSALADLSPFAGTCFDPGERPFSYTYSYAYAGADTGKAADPPNVNNDSAAGAGVTNSQGWQATFDISGLPADPNYGGSHAWTYFGVALDIVGLRATSDIPASSNLASFVLSFDARVGGLDASKTSTKLNLNFLRFSAPDGTLTNQVPDGKDDLLIGLQYNNILINSNWTHFEIPLTDMVIKDGSPADLANPDYLFALVNFGSFPMEFTTTTASDWGYDADNSVTIDNLYLSSTNAPPPAPIQEASVLAQANFDTTFPGTSFSYWYCADAVQGVSTAWSATSGGGVGGSNALVIRADSTGFSSLYATPAWSGFGGGTVFSLSESLRTTNLNAYRVYWNARTEGLLPDTLTQVPCSLAIQLIAPDGTTGPTDGKNDMILEVNAGFNVSSNYQDTPMVMELDKGTIGTANGGSMALFAQYFSQVTEVQLNIQQSDFYADYLWAPGNVLALDDIKLVRLAVANPPLSIALNNGHLQVTWDSPSVGVTKLQSATSVLGPFADVSGATSPYTVPSGSAALFFRTHWLPQ